MWPEILRRTKTSNLAQNPWSDRVSQPALPGELDRCEYFLARKLHRSNFSSHRVRVCLAILAAKVRKLTLSRGCKFRRTKQNKFKYMFNSVRIKISTKIDKTTINYHLFYFLLSTVYLPEIHRGDCGHLHNTIGIKNYSFHFISFHCICWFLQVLQIYNFSRRKEEKKWHNTM